MREDLERGYTICGQHPEYMRGKLTKKFISRAPVDQMGVERESRDMTGDWHFKVTYQYCEVEALCQPSCRSTQYVQEQ
jgi:hypothetical protein